MEARSERALRFPLVEQLRGPALRETEEIGHAPCLPSELH
jgi:hypothetical protein